MTLDRFHRFCIIVKRYISAVVITSFKMRHKIITFKPIFVCQWYSKCNNLLCYQLSNPLIMAEAEWMKALLQWLNYDKLTCDPTLISERDCCYWTVVNAHQNIKQKEVKLLLCNSSSEKFLFWEELWKKPNVLVIFTANCTLYLSACFCSYK